jgi:hypothetical protein
MKSKTKHSRFESLLDTEWIIPSVQILHNEVIYHSKIKLPLSVFISHYEAIQSNNHYDNLICMKSRLREALYRHHHLISYFGLYKPSIEKKSIHQQSKLNFYHSYHQYLRKDHHMKPSMSMLSSDTLYRTPSKSQANETIYLSKLHSSQCDQNVDHTDRRDCLSDMDEDINEASLPNPLQLNLYYSMNHSIQHQCSSYDQHDDRQRVLDGNDWLIYLTLYDEYSPDMIELFDNFYYETHHICPNNNAAYQSIRLSTCMNHRLNHYPVLKDPYQPFSSQKEDTSFSNQTSYHLHSSKDGLPHPAYTYELDLRNQQLCDTTIYLLCQEIQSSQHLTILNLTHTKINPFGALLLSYAIAANYSLSTIIYRTNYHHEKMIFKEIFFKSIQLGMMKSFTKRMGLAYFIRNSKQLSLSVLEIILEYLLGYGPLVKKFLRYKYLHHYLQWKR